jgi:hypothetical protein
MRPWRACVGEVITSPDAVAGRAFDGDRDTCAGCARAVADGLDPLTPASADGDATLPVDAFRVDDARRPLNSGRPKNP